MHGRSNNVSEAGEATTFTWAARMHFTRDKHGKVLIDTYTIIPVSCATSNKYRFCQPGWLII